MPDYQDALNLLSETQKSLDKVAGLVDVLLRTNTHPSGPNDVYNSTVKFKETLEVLIVEYEETLETARR